VKEAARDLRMKPHQVYYLLSMGEIEAVKIGDVWRLVPEAVDEYDKRFPERKNREPAAHPVRPGSGGFLFDKLPDRIPPDPLGEAGGVERRRKRLVRRAARPADVLLAELKPVTQLELFTV
jgi:excisionase family DNA binding protein